MIYYDCKCVFGSRCKSENLKSENLQFNKWPSPQSKNVAPSLRSAVRELAAKSTKLSLSWLDKDSPGCGFETSHINF